MRALKVSFVSAACAAAFSFPALAMPPSCAKLTVSEFQAFGAALTAAEAAIVRANAAVGVIPVVQPSYLNDFKLAWDASKKPWQYDYPSALNNFDLTVNPIGDDLIGSLAPYISVEMGYGLNWRIGHFRYWSGIGVFYNRASLPSGKGLNPDGKTTAEIVKSAYDAVGALHIVAERINQNAVDCMGAL